MIKTDYKDRALDVPASVERCVHFVAAHEKRCYQRLDSLEKTRGEQFLYTGTRCDVVGGTVKGSLDAEMQRQGVIMSMISTRPPADQALLLKLKAERDAADKHVNDLVGTAPHDFTNVLTRRRHDADRLVKQAGEQARNKREVQDLRDNALSWVDPAFVAGQHITAAVLEHRLLSDDQMTLVDARKGSPASTRSPPTSWPCSTCWFTTRC